MEKIFEQMKIHLSEIEAVLRKRVSERNTCIDAIVRIAIPALEHAIEIIRSEAAVSVPFGELYEEKALAALRKLMEPQ